MSRDRDPLPPAWLVWGGILAASLLFWYVVYRVVAAAL